MVRLQVKRQTENQFLYETTVTIPIQKLIKEIVSIYNGRLKIERICREIEELCDHGIALPPEMVGLTDEQIDELKLIDSWSDKCIPSGGYIINKDQMGRRNGRQPQLKMQEILKKTIEDAKKMIDKKIIDQNICITLKTIEEAINLLRGAVTIVYPMQLPPHDPIRMEFTNTEELSESYACSEVIEPGKAQLWFAGHNMLPEKTLQDYVGNNDKTKVVIKIQKMSEGAPGREPPITEEQKKQLMLQAYRRQEELKMSVCLEQRAFYRLISGLHTSINIHLCSKYLLSENKDFLDPKGIWGPNINEFKRRFSPETTNNQGPHWLKNLYFIYLVELRALAKAAPYLKNEEYYTGNAEEDHEVKLAVKDLLNVIESFPSHFDETQMFSKGLESIKLKNDFREKFRNISRIMDCVGCDKCRLWGKLQTQGLGTALKILFSDKFNYSIAPIVGHNNWEFYTSSFDYRMNIRITRTEIVALMNAFGRLSDSIFELENFRQILR